jgi:hypothetical protein
MVMRSARTARKKKGIRFDEMGPDAGSGPHGHSLFGIAVDKIDK